MRRKNTPNSPHLALALALALVACSGVAPDIDRVNWQLSLQVSPRNQRYEVLSLFVLARDDDGFGDLEEAYLVWLEDGTSWWIPDESWRLQESNSDDYRWLVHTALQPLSGGVFPRGAYRVLLYDHSGQKDSLNFNLQFPRTALNRVAVPVPRTLGIGLLVEQLPDGGAILRGYDYGGSLLFEQPLVKGELVFSRLRQNYAELARVMVDFRVGALPVRVGPYKVF